LGANAGLAGVDGQHRFGHGNRLLWMVDVMIQE
jgi:hypothetical protein